MFFEKYPLCECGCGGRVNYFRGVWRRFVNGHNSKNKGRKFSEDIRNRMSEAHIGLPSGFKGKHHKKINK